MRDSNYDPVEFRPELNNIYLTSAYEIETNLLYPIIERWRKNGNESIDSQLQSAYILCKMKVADAHLL